MALRRLPDIGDSVGVDATDSKDLDEDGLPSPVTVRLQVTRLDGRRTDRLLLPRVPAGEVSSWAPAQPYCSQSSC